MTFTQQIMRRLNFPLACHGPKALCPSLYSSSHHPVLQTHVRCYRRPGSSPEYKSLWKYLNPINAVKNTTSSVNLMFKEIKNHLLGPGGRQLDKAIAEKTTVLWNFRGPEDLQSWVVSTDVEIGGKSQAFLEVGKNNQTARFYGVLNSEIPRDGETTDSGYCTLRSKPNKGAFGRKLHSDWSKFNTLHLRIRGDGRPWMVNIQSETFFTVQWDDLYQYFIYTRGGPYWQDVKIPLSKFFISSRGRVQDGQYPLWPDKITTLGFTLADRADGPFQLEIDFIGLTVDHSHTEEFAYEMYKHIPM